eukprot:363988-Chlamydomonas_euryale.AAC.2
MLCQRERGVEAAFGRMAFARGGEGPHTQLKVTRSTAAHPKAGTARAAALEKRVGERQAPPPPKATSPPPPRHPACMMRHINAGGRWTSPPQAPWHV